MPKRISRIDEGAISMGMGGRFAARLILDESILDAFAGHRGKGLVVYDLYDLVMRRRRSNKKGGERHGAQDGFDHLLYSRVDWQFTNSTIG
jgi:hypothetical protein